MQQHNDVRRLFFGFEVSAPWPLEYPKGRLIDEKSRHITVCFLGNVPYQTVQELINKLPTSPIHVGLTGIFDKVLFLPSRHPRVAAWHIDWLDDSEYLMRFQREMSHCLQSAKVMKEEKREFLPHVTIARAPFDYPEWKRSFTSLPLAITHLHLYESLGSLQYVPRWTRPLLLPFEEMEHTADIAFKIRGEGLPELFTHAQTALGFIFPGLVKFMKKAPSLENLNQIVELLNQIVSEANAKVGCPFKAVSYHGKITTEKDNILSWEMIIDV